MFEGTVKVRLCDWTEPNFVAAFSLVFDSTARLAQKGCKAAVKARHSGGETCRAVPLGCDRNIHRLTGQSDAIGGE